MKYLLLCTFILLLAKGNAALALNDSLWEIERNNYQYPALPEPDQKKKPSASEQSLKEQKMQTDGTKFYRIAIFILIVLLLTSLLYVALKRLNVNRLNEEDNSPLEWSSLEKLDPHAPDLDALLKLAEKEHDQRSIVRLQFLKLVKHMHVNHLIEWKANKTNTQLAAEIGDDGLHSIFLQILGLYHSFWYGKRQPTAMESNQWSELYEQSMRIIRRDA